MSLVSIITPTYNSELTIEETYKSIISQKYENWEWIVTDDCSVDSTYHKLLELSKADNRIKVFKTTNNSGAAVTRNKSISEAKGHYIAFLDSDDIWHEIKLSEQVKYMEENFIDFSFTSYDIIDEFGFSVGQVVDKLPLDPLSYEDMLRKKATLGCSTVMLRRECFPDIFMPLIRTGQDYALWLKLLKSGSYAHHMPQVLTSYRLMPNSISRNKIKKARRQWSIYRDIEQLSWLKSIECFLLYAWRAVFRR